MKKVMKKILLKKIDQCECIWMLVLYEKCTDKFYSYIVTILTLSLGIR